MQVVEVTTIQRVVVPSSACSVNICFQSFWSRYGNLKTGLLSVQHILIIKAEEI